MPVEQTLATVLHSLIMYGLPMLIGVGAGALAGKRRIRRGINALLLALTVFMAVLAQYTAIYFAMRLWMAPEPPNARPDVVQWSDLLRGFLYYGWIGGIISGPVTFASYVVGYYWMRGRDRAPGVAMTFPPPPTPTPADRSPS